MNKGEIKEKVLGFLKKQKPGVLIAYVCGLAALVCAVILGVRFLGREKAEDGEHTGYWQIRLHPSRKSALLSALRLRQGGHTPIPQTS